MPHTVVKLVVFVLKKHAEAVRQALGRAKLVATLLPVFQAKARANFCLCVAPSPPLAKLANLKWLKQELKLFVAKKT